MNKLEKITAKNMSETEYFFGHKACAGCGGSLAVRYALKVLGDNTFAVLPAGCMSAVGFIYPQMAFQNNAIISPFPGAASMASGLAAGLKALDTDNSHTVVFAGDGGTADIGLQALSGAIDRNDNIIYICYDNEAYMNTGIQKSGLTPYGTKTTTTPAGKNMPGSITSKKRIFEIIAAHGIEYAATASVGFPIDYMNKINKAKNVNGTSFIHVYSPCPTGWGCPTDSTIALGKQVVSSGLWYLAEYENSRFTLNRRPKEFTPIDDYLKSQGRFKHLTAESIAEIERQRDLKWAGIDEQWAKPL